MNCLYFINSLLLISLLNAEEIIIRSIVDLTHTYDKKYTPSHPKDSSFDLRLVQRGKMKPGVWYYNNDIFTGEHVGTHIDAPIYINKDMHAVDQIPLESLYRIPGVLINVIDKVKQNHNYQVKVSDIKNWIEEHGSIPDGSIIIFRTGWGSQALNQKVYTGVDDYGNLNFPGISKEAAEWIVNYQNSTTELINGIVAVAIDTLSLDAGNNPKVPAHLTLLENGIYGIENVANAGELPPNGFTITMLPMKIAKGSGGPIRMIAEVNGEPFTTQDSSSENSKKCSWALLTFHLFALLTIWKIL